jgi:hypothetical protein
LIVIVFAVPAFGLIANPGMVLMILWWASVGLLAAKQIWDNKNVVLYQVREHSTIKFPFVHFTLVLDKYLPIIQIVLIIAVFASWVYLLSIVAGLATQGLI